MYFEDKKIFIISPQTWSSNKISKHHYAEGLSSSGAKVFFVNPIKHGFRWDTEMNNINENLNVITIHVPFPKVVRFKLRFLFDYIVRLRFKNILKKIGIPDILWNFDNGIYFRYEDLFRHSFRIFHPVDMLLMPSNLDFDSKYDIVFSVSSEILKKINHKRKYFINHGLHKGMVDYYKNKNSSASKKKCENVTYMGNISIPFLNREAILNLIHRNPQIEFRMIGELDLKCAFQKKLNNLKNVVFYGRLSGTDLYKVLKGADLLLICYKKHSFYNADNSHKILEYLSTGNPIISSPLSVYKNHSDIISFIDFENDNYVELFKKMVENYAALNTPEKRQKRIALALNNTYQKQIERIEEIIHTI